jgi:hypothetical protein
MVRGAVERGVVGSESVRGVYVSSVTFFVRFGRHGCV